MRALIRATSRKSIILLILVGIINSCANNPSPLAGNSSCSRAAQPTTTTSVTFPSSGRPGVVALYQTSITDAEANEAQIAFMNKASLACIHIALAQREWTSRRLTLYFEPLYFAQDRNQAADLLRSIGIFRSVQVLDS